MEHSMSVGKGLERAGEDGTWDLERKLASAERKYAQARELSRKARDECRALEAEPGAREELVLQARARYEAAEAKCNRLRQQIDDLEERLD